MNFCAWRTSWTTFWNGKVGDEKKAVLKPSAIRLDIFPLSETSVSFVKELYRINETHIRLAVNLFLLLQCSQGG